MITRKETRTIQEIDFDIKRETGKRDQQMALGTPGGMMLATHHQNNIDSLLEEKKALSSEWENLCKEFEKALLMVEHLIPNSLKQRWFQVKAEGDRNAEKLKAVRVLANDLIEGADTNEKAIQEKHQGEWNYPQEVRGVMSREAKLFRKIAAQLLEVSA